MGHNELARQSRVAKCRLLGWQAPEVAPNLASRAHLGPGERAGRAIASVLANCSLSPTRSRPAHKLIYKFNPKATRAKLAPSGGLGTKAFRSDGQVAY